jgi:hypothetical protein
MPELNTHQQRTENMKTITRRIQIAFLVTAVLASGLLGAWAGPYGRINVQLDYEGSGKATATFKKKVKPSDDPKAKDKDLFALPAKVLVDEIRGYSIKFDIGEQTIYGVLLTRKGTEFTMMSAIRVPLSRETIEKVLKGEVIQITVNDPTTKTTVLEMLLGDSPTDQGLAERMARERWERKARGR